MDELDENRFWALSLFGEAKILSVNKLHTEVFANNLNKYEDAMTYLNDLKRHGYVGIEPGNNGDNWILFDIGQKLHKRLKSKIESERWRQNTQDIKLKSDTSKSIWDNRIKVVVFILAILTGIWMAIQIGKATYDFFK